MYYDLAGREFSRKPYEIGTLIRVYFGCFDTFEESLIHKDIIAIVAGVEREHGTLDPMYDSVIVDKEGKITDTMYRVRQRLCCKAGLKLSSSKYQSLCKVIEKIKRKYA